MGGGTRRARPRLRVGAALAAAVTVLDRDGRTAPAEQLSSTLLDLSPVPPSSAPPSWTSPPPCRPAQLPAAPSPSSRDDRRRPDPATLHGRENSMQFVSQKKNLNTSSFTEEKSQYILCHRSKISAHFDEDNRAPLSQHSSAQ